MFICPECGKQVSDKAVMCIECGFPIERISNRKHIYCPHTTIKPQFGSICPECEAGVSYQATMCTECGFPLKEDTTEIVKQTPQHKKIDSYNDYAQYNKPKKRRLYLIPIITIVLCIAVIVPIVIIHSLNGEGIIETDYERTNSNNISGISDITTAYESSTQPPTTVQKTIKYMVIAGSYSDKENADEAVKQLSEKGFTSFVEWTDEFQVFRIVAGLFDDRNSADELVSALSSAGFESFVRIIEPISTSENTSSNEWKQLYTDIIKNDSMYSHTDWKSFALIYMNDDAIPELVLEPFSRGQTITVYSVINGELVSFTDTARGFSYIERGNLIFYGGSFGGVLYEGVISIQNGQFVKRFNGERRSIGDYIYDSWYIDSVEVSEEEYQRTLILFYNESEFTHSEFYTASEIIERINDPNWGST
jgi:ribosomal protein L40E